MAAELSIVPANQASWTDLETVVGPMRCHGMRCYCQRFKMGWNDWMGDVPDEERAHRLRAQTDCGHPGNGPTSGLVAYIDGEPAGWCNVEPRPNFPDITDTRIATKKRGEDRADPTVWVAACFVVRTRFRWGGLMRRLAPAAVDFARQRGARALEAYPMVTVPGVETTWGELHVGSRNVFAEAGLDEVAHPTKRRFVMRIDF